MNFITENYLDSVLPETKKGGAHRAPFLYEFYLENYEKALENGLFGGW